MQTHIGFRALPHLSLCFPYLNCPSLSLSLLHCGPFLLPLSLSTTIVPHPLPLSNSDIHAATHLVFPFVFFSSLPRTAKPQPPPLLGTGIPPSQPPLPFSRHRHPTQSAPHTICRCNQLFLTGRWPSSLESAAQSSSGQRSSSDHMARSGFILESR